MIIIERLNRFGLCCCSDMAAAPVSTPLPPGWEAIVDGASGRFDFINHMTKQTGTFSPFPLDWVVGIVIIL